MKAPRMNITEFEPVGTITQFNEASKYTQSYAPTTIAMKKKTNKNMNTYTMCLAMNEITFECCRFSTVVVCSSAGVRVRCSVLAPIAHSSGSLK